MGKIVDKTMHSAVAEVRAARIFMTVVVAAFLLVSWVARAAEDDTPVHLISNELFDALEVWSGEELSDEDVALESYPEVIYSYAELARNFYPGSSIKEHFEQSFPDAVDSLTALTEGESYDDGDLIFYVMGFRKEDYQRWQEEVAVRGSSTFRNYVGQNHPEMVVHRDRMNLSPADEGIPLVSFVTSLERPELEEEVRDFLGPTRCPSSDCCECRVVMALPSQPYHRELEILEAEDVYVPPIGRRISKYAVLSQGAAKTMIFELLLAQHLSEKEASKESNYSQLRVRLTCTEDGVAGGLQCQSGACSGELALGVEYASQVFEDIEVAGAPISRRAQAIVADTAFLRYDPPGPGTEMTLFEKGVAVSGDFKTEWDSEAVIETLLAGTELAVVIATYGAAAVLDTDLGNRLLQGIVGLVKREGETGSVTQDMVVGFDTADSVPFALMPNITHRFRLETQSKFYARGYGPNSGMRMKVLSSKYIAAVARNFQCTGGAFAPDPVGCWHWASGGAPESADTLQHLVRDWVAVELDLSPLDVPAEIMSPQRGCYYP